MHYQISGLDPSPFLKFYGMTTAELSEHAVLRYEVDQPDAYPDRVELKDAEVGETVLLVNYTHQPARTPYYSSHAIFVREGARNAAKLIDTIPRSLATRPLSLRAFDNEHLIVDGRLIDGAAAEKNVLELLAKSEVSYIHAHLARRGCYAALIERA